MAGQFKEVFRRKGITALDIRPGDVWTVKDKIINFPEERLPEGFREKHIYRTVVVVSRLDECQDNIEYKSITVIPTSTKCNIKSPTDFSLPQEMGGLKYDSYARTRMVQPVLKTDLEKKVGSLPTEIFISLKTMLLTHLDFFKKE